MIHTSFIGKTLDEILFDGYLGGHEKVSVDEWRYMEQLLQTLREDSFQEGVDSVADETSNLEDEISSLDRECDELSGRVEYLEGLLTENNIEFEKGDD